LAIVHVAMKSSSNAPPAAAHAEYIARDGQYAMRGGVDLVESGNMPEFAQADARAFWVAADAHERANGRTYTELQIALPRELDTAQRIELARDAAREFMGDRFAYTMALHTPLAKDNIEQPHLHLMFSERAIDATTRALPEDRFFKRNGAKKDRETWHDRDKPEEIRARWCEMMNRAMEREGIELRVDPRSWADQGREDLAELREPKTLGGKGEEAAARREEIAERRRLREELPPAHLDGPAAVEKLEREAEAQIAEIERKLDEELNLLDRMIAAVKEVAKAVFERAAAKLHEFFPGERAQAAVAQPESPPQLAEELAEARYREWEARQEREQTYEARYREWEAKDAAKERQQQEQEAQERRQRDIPERSIEIGKKIGHER